MRVYKAERTSTRMHFPSTGRVLTSQVVQINPLAFVHKEYPKCKCGIAFVPEKAGDFKCYFCRKKNKRGPNSFFDWQNRK